MKRRTLLTFGALTAGSILMGAGGGVATLRLHKAPRRHPALTDSHLVSMRTEATLVPDSRTKILFVGNSNTLLNDIPSRVAFLARERGWHPWVQTAAANGARLIETVRLGEFRKTVANVQWDALVLQDFSRTPLRPWDRFGSSLAIRTIASLAPQARVVLFPSWPDAIGHPIYSDNGGYASARLTGPEDFADKTERFYGSIAESDRFVVAPVVPRWMAATESGAQLYATDQHHSNETGAALVAEAILDAMKLDL
jgi:hypothetical protein